MPFAKKNRKFGGFHPALRGMLPIIEADTENGGGFDGSEQSGDCFDLPSRLWVLERISLKSFGGSIGNEAAPADRAAGVLVSD